MRLRLGFVVVLLAGCSSNTLPVESDTDENGYAQSAYGYGWCVAKGKRCKVGGTACCGARFCQDSGYGYGRCSDPLPDGAWCTDASQCKSGGCNANVCGVPCAADTQSCWSGAQCCSGHCTFPGYGKGMCAAPLADGEYCGEASECQSKQCVEYRCAPLQCVNTGKTCWSSTMCCSGFCAIGYIDGLCAAPQANGSYCRADSECQSKHCTDYQCTAS
jgi:hypothetical protein